MIEDKSKMQKAKFNEFMTELKDMDAAYPNKESPGTVILYSGNDTEFGKQNLQIARDCTKKVPNSYTIHETEAGRYLDKKIHSLVKEDDSGVITKAQYHELWDEASRMLVNQAKGSALAVTRGAINIDSTFMRVEMKEILEGRTGITSINDIPVHSLRFGELNKPSYGMITLKVIDSPEQCKEVPVENKQPMTILDKALQHIPHAKLPTLPDRELEELERPNSAPVLAPALNFLRSVDNSQQNHHFHNLVANDPALAQSIANASANLKDSGVDLRQASLNNSAPYIRGELAAAKMALS